MFVGRHEKSCPLCDSAQEHVWQCHAAGGRGDCETPGGEEKLSAGEDGGEYFVGFKVCDEVGYEAE